MLAEAARRKTRHKGTWRSNLPLCCQTKASEDKKEIEAGEVLETHKTKLRYEDSREKKKVKRDEAPKLLEKEEEKKRKTHKRLKKRSCSKEKYEFNEEKRGEGNQNSKEDES